MQGYFFTLNFWNTCFSSCQTYAVTSISKWKKCFNMKRIYLSLACKTIFLYVLHFLYMVSEWIKGRRVFVKNMSKPHKGLDSIHMLHLVLHFERTFSEWQASIKFPLEVHSNRITTLLFMLNWAEDHFHSTQILRRMNWGLYDYYI